jgi:hypothetical protein
LEVAISSAFDLQMADTKIHIAFPAATPLGDVNMAKIQLCFESTGQSPD